jgi:hypothetical protein
MVRAVRGINRPLETQGASSKWCSEVRGNAKEVRRLWRYVVIQVIIWAAQSSEVCVHFFARAAIRESRPPVRSRCSLYAQPSGFSS